MDGYIIFYVLLILVCITLFFFVCFIMESANHFSLQYLRDIVYNVAVEYKLETWHFLQRKLESVAQNYFGVIIPGRLFGYTKEGQRKDIFLVLKLAPTDERYRVSGAMTYMFAREIYVYTVLLAEMSKLQERYPFESRHIIPQCYYTSKQFLKEVLVLQDMCADGYQPYNRDFFLDSNHISVSIQALAKYHALCFNLKADNFKLFQEAAQICLPLTQMNNIRFIQIVFDRLQKALEIFADTQYVPLLDYYKNNLVMIIDSTYTSVKQSCICHGDIWKENLLFKYEGQVPVAACMIDYQTARICGPAYDLLYLIITSTSNELRRVCYSELIDIYYRSFTHTLKQANLFAEEIYTRQQLDEDLKTVAPGCLIVANTTMWLACGLQEDGYVRSKVQLKTVQQKRQAIEKYKGIMKGIFDDFFTYEYLQGPKILFKDFCIPV